MAKIIIEAENTFGLHTLLDRIARQPGLLDAPQQYLSDEDMQGAVEAMSSLGGPIDMPEAPKAKKRGPGRPRKAPNGDMESAAPPEAGAPDPESPNVPPLVDLDPSFGDLPDLPLQNPPSAGGLDETPAEMRKRATELLKVMVEKSAANLDHVKRFRSKYGVTKFNDLPDDRAAEFLADVLLAEATFSPPEGSDSATVE